jgi:hypothetical protein
MDRSLVDPALISIVLRVGWRESECEGRRGRGRLVTCVACSVSLLVVRLVGAVAKHGDWGRRGVTVKLESQ